MGPAALLTQKRTYSKIKLYNKFQELKHSRKSQPAQLLIFCDEIQCFRQLPSTFYLHLKLILIRQFKRISPFHFDFGNVCGRIKQTEVICNLCVISMKVKCWQLLLTSEESDPARRCREGIISSAAAAAAASLSSNCQSLGGQGNFGQKILQLILSLFLRGPLIWIFLLRVWDLCPGVLISLDGLRSFSFPFTFVSSGRCNMIPRTGKW